VPGPSDSVTARERTRDSRPNKHMVLFDAGSAQGRNSCRQRTLAGSWAASAAGRADRFKLESIGGLGGTRQRGLALDLADHLDGG